MADNNLLTAGAIAQKIGKPVPQVKKAIAELKLKPAAKKGACTYFAAADVPKIKASIK